MNLLALDLEFNQPSQKIISVGFYICKHTGEMLQATNIIVNPFEELNPDITTLTRITQEEVNNGETVREAYDYVCAMRESFKCIRMPIVWGGAYSNDSHSLWKQATNGIEGLNLLGNRFIDVKSIWQARQMFKNSTIQGGLGKSMKKAGLEWDGEYGLPHNSLADAYNTMRMFLHLHKD